MSNMQSFVSVVIPVSEPDFFRESMNSICHQSHQNLEIIIVDSSQDQEEIKAILSAMKDERIRYFYQEKCGVANALNFGIEKASGRYIARMDADDIALFHRIALQAEFMDTHPEVDVVASSYLIVDDAGKIRREEKKQCSGDELRYGLLFDNPICHPTVMFRRTLFEHGWRYQNVFAEDYDFWTRLAVSHEIEVLPDILLKYRVHENNLSSVNIEMVLHSDGESTLGYINSLFDMSMAPDRKALLIKNYHLSQLTIERVGESGDFLLSQYELLYGLCKMAMGVSEKKRVALRKTVLHRWKKLLFVSNLLFPVEELCAFPFPWEEVNAEAFKKRLFHMIRENDGWIRKMYEKKMKFFLYGLGERGYRTLRRYQELRDGRLKNWELLGVVDKQRKGYFLGGEMLTTCTKEEMLTYDFDYILISAFDFYEEVREELMRLKVPERKIMRDNIIYFCRKEENLCTGPEYR